MSAPVNLARPASGLFEQVRPELLAEPLEFIFADHFRQRVLCAELRRLAAQGRVPEGEAREIVGFLRKDMVLHHQDEELDLFPAVRRRALPEDNLKAVLDRLGDDHQASEPVAGEIASALDASPDAGAISIPERIQKKMLALAASEHRHLAIENGLVMTLARVRLTRADLVRMSAAMRARRGLPVGE